MLIFLYKKRQKFSVFSYLWVKCWLKRLIHSPALFAIAFRNSIFRRFGASIGDLSIIECTLNLRDCKNIKVGDHTYISKCANISLHDELVVGSNVAINSRVAIYTASHEINDPLWPLKKNRITISDYAWIASESILLPGVKIGYGAVVGAGAVVRSDVPDYGVAIGNPAKVVGFRSGPFRYSPTAFVSQFECWLGADRLYCDGADT